MKMFKYLDKKFDEWHELYFKETRDKFLFSILVFAGFSSLMVNHFNQWMALNFAFDVILLTINIPSKEENKKNSIKKSIDFDELEKTEIKNKINSNEEKSELMLGQLFKNNK